MALPVDASLVAVDKFIQATRDSGYKGTTSAVSELVDNSLQAGARRVWIQLSAVPDDMYPVEVVVLDDGCGMDEPRLVQALRFGGSSRFNDRAGLGRYGMGLPNASLSQARRVEVFSWEKPDRTLFSYLDVDEIASGRLCEVPGPKAVAQPTWGEIDHTPSGTAVVWKRCDRLDNRRISTMARKVAESLGRIFRHFLWKSVEIRVNGTIVAPIDPLYLRRPSLTQGGRIFGEELTYKIKSPSTDATPQVGIVTVQFSELPVHEWHPLSNEDKRAKGVSNGAGISVVRGGREIDYGWFFMGRKRRENYDDWWRCEVSFDPVLDEAFGITHTKQQIRPRDYLLEILTPDLENMARALNSRVRQAHLDIKAVQGAEQTERIATERSRLLKPLPRKSKPSRDQAALLGQLMKRYPGLRELAKARGNGAMRYRVVEDRFKETLFYNFVLDENRLILAMNSEHPFYRKLYRLLASDVPGNGDSMGIIKTQLDLLILAAARTEASLSAAERRTLQKFRKLWSDTLATFLNA